MTMNGDTRGYLFHPSGGLIYQIRALRYSGKYWKNHIAHVEKFLNRWAPPKTSLLLVGPSAGYSLPLSWLSQFKSITAVEPDPMARLLFERRFSFPGGFNFKWEKNKFDFSLPRKEEVILFSNVLGQIDLEDELLAADAIKKLCEGKSWASYHDVLSGKDFRWSSSGEGTEKRTLDSLKQGVEAVGESEIELNAHAVYDFFKADPSLHFEYWEWQITQQQTQVIEGVFKR